MKITNRKVLESNIRGLEFTINLKEKSKLTAKEKESLEEDHRLLAEQKEKQEILDRVGEEMYTKMYPYS